jgi:ArsR family transcriptional regulator, virulence genes transcriptional regulator
MPSRRAIASRSASVSARLRQPTATHGLEGTNWNRLPSPTSVTRPPARTSPITSSAARVPPRPAPRTTISRMSHSLFPPHKKGGSIRSQVSFTWIKRPFIFRLTIYAHLRIYEHMKITAARMERAAGAASELLKALANPHRLMIVCRLLEGEHAVGELAAALGLRDSTVSQHLALLRRDRLVRTRRDGQTIWYTIASEPARAVLQALFRVYCSPGRSGRAARAASHLRLEVNQSRPGGSRQSAPRAENPTR